MCAAGKYAPGAHKPTKRIHTFSITEKIPQKKGHRVIAVEKNYLNLFQ